MYDDVRTEPVELYSMIIGIAAIIAMVAVYFIFTSKRNK